MSAKDVIELKKQYFFPNAMHFYKNPPLLVSGEGMTLIDDTGKAYLDFFAGVTVANCGHCNAEISKQVQEQVGKLQHTSIIYLTKPMGLLAKKLGDLLPGDINRSFFCCSGTEANEGALLLARMHTQKKGFLAFKGGLHGRSHLTMSVTGIPMWRIDPYLEEDVYFAEGFFNDGGADRQAVSDLALKSVEDILKEHGTDIAACIVEPMQGNGGMHYPAPDFFTRLKRLLESYGVLLIVDEIQTGFGRTGKLFGIEHYGVVPDIMTMAKALGNGQPIGVFSAREHVASSLNKPSASTLGGNPVSMVAGLAVLDYIKDHDLVAHSADMGAYLLDYLSEIGSTNDNVQDVRGLGHMIGMELGRPELVDEVLEKMKDLGFIIGKNGINRNVLAFQPPLIVEKEHIDKMIEALKQVLKV
ncbi:MAG: aspartate aminotransferase family protein [Vallitaleaceae bacterium]|jgi:alanine-glyoxylate transaminase/(R)-3-amino-2-methylpropionate-pyruvate transaminase|nr:aspartate aminotransferase family protein [Vallitaleaceae bacterium]